MSRIREDEVVEANLLGHLAGGREQVDQELAEMIGPDTVEIVLALAPRLDEPETRSSASDG